MKIILILFLLFSLSIQSTASDLKDEIQKLKTENELLKKDLTLTNEKLELITKQTSYKSENLDNLAKQIETNEKNFDGTLSLFSFMVFVLFILIIIFGFYKNGQIHSAREEMKQDLEDFKKNVKDNIDLTLANLHLLENTRKQAFEEYKNEAEKLINATYGDENKLNTRLEEAIEIWQDELLLLKTKCCPNHSKQSVSYEHTALVNKHNNDNPMNSTDDLLE